MTPSTGTTMAGTNTAFIFVKPAALTPAVIDLVRRHLASHGITVTAEGSVTGPEMDARCTIDRHYSTIARYALDTQPVTVKPPQSGLDAFSAAYGMAWADAIQQGLVVNAGTASVLVGEGPAELTAIWNAQSTKKTKLAPGLYVGRVATEDSPASGAASPLAGHFVLNGFYPGNRERFCAPTAAVHWFVAEWAADALPWGEFRHRIIGATNPAQAVPESLRGRILAKWKELGLAAAPNNSDNGVHGSASPLEAFFERRTWLGSGSGADSSSDQVISSNDPFGRLLQQRHVDPAFIRALSANPVATLRGTTAPVFDLLEDQDTSVVVSVLPEVELDGAAFDAALHEAAELEALGNSGGATTAAVKGAAAAPRPPAVVASKAISKPQQLKPAATPRAAAAPHAPAASRPGKGSYGTVKVTAPPPVSDGAATAAPAPTPRPKPKGPPQLAFGRPVPEPIAAPPAASNAPADLSVETPVKRALPQPPAVIPQRAQAAPGVVKPPAAGSPAAASPRRRAPPPPAAAAGAASSPQDTGSTTRRAKSEPSRVGANNKNGAAVITSPNTARLPPLNQRTGGAAGAGASPATARNASSPATAKLLPPIKGAASGAAASPRAAAAAPKPAPKAVGAAALRSLSRSSSRSSRSSSVSSVSKVSYSHSSRASSAPKPPQGDAALQTAANSAVSVSRQAPSVVPSAAAPSAKTPASTKPSAKTASAAGGGSNAARKPPAGAGSLPPMSAAAAPPKAAPSSARAPVAVAAGAVKNPLLSPVKPTAAKPAAKGERKSIDSRSAAPVPRTPEHQEKKGPATEPPAKATATATPSPQRAEAPAHPTTAAATTTAPPDASSASAPTAPASPISSAAVQAAALQVAEPLFTDPPRTEGGQRKAVNAHADIIMHDYAAKGLVIVVENRDASSTLTLTFDFTASDNLKISHLAAGATSHLTPDSSPSGGASTDAALTRARLFGCKIVVGAKQTCNVCHLSMVDAAKNAYTMKYKLSAKISPVASGARRGSAAVVKSPSSTRRASSHQRQTVSRGSSSGAGKKKDDVTTNTTSTPPKPAQSKTATAAPKAPAAPAAGTTASTAAAPTTPRKAEAAATKIQAAVRGSQARGKARVLREGRTKQAEEEEKAAAALEHTLQAEEAHP